MFCQFQDPEIANFCQFLDPEIAKMVDTSYIIFFMLLNETPNEAILAVVQRDGQKVTGTKAKPKIWETPCTNTLQESY